MLVVCDLRSADSAAEGGGVAFGQDKEGAC